MKNYKNESGVSREEIALEKFADMMIAKIEAITIDWQKPWFSTHYKTTPVNMDGRKYNGMNYFMLQLICDDKDYKTPCFITHSRLNKFNYDKDGKPIKPFVGVKKGEVSTPVFMTIFNVKDAKTMESISYDEYQQLDDEAKKGYKVYPNLQVFNVFNIDQTNLEETRPDVYKKLVDKYGKSEPPKTGKKFHFKKADSMIEEQNWFCPINIEKGDKSCYSPVLDRITLPEFKLFKTGEAFYSTLFHEMAHSLGHESRMNRADGMTAKYGSKEYGKEELIAEMSAALCCHTYGFDNGVKEEAASYLKGWCKMIKEKPNFIKSVLLDVKKCYAKITDRIDTIE